MKYKYMVLYHGMQERKLYASNDKELDNVINWCIYDMINNCWFASYETFELKGRYYREVK